MPKIFAALKSLNSLGNKYYQFVANLDQFKKRCSDTGDCDLLLTDETEELEQENTYETIDISIEDEVLNVQNLEEIISKGEKNKDL